MGPWHAHRRAGWPLGVREDGGVFQPKNRDRDKERFSWPQLSAPVRRTPDLSKRLSGPSTGVDAHRESLPRLKLSRFSAAPRFTMLPWA